MDDGVVWRALAREGDQEKGRQIEQGGGTAPLLFKQYTRQVITWPTVQNAVDSLQRAIINLAIHKQFSMRVLVRTANKSAPSRIPAFKPKQPDQLGDRFGQKQNQHILTHVFVFLTAAIRTHYKDVFAPECF